MVAHIFRQLMEALQFLHGRNLFHRDLKTENMLVSREDGRYTLKVADFGRTVGARNRINVNVSQRVKPELALLPRSQSPI